jgi:hypothetical protein
MKSLSQSNGVSNIWHVGVGRLWANCTKIRFVWLDSRLFALGVAESELFSFGVPHETHFGVNPPRQTDFGVSFGLESHDITIYSPRAAPTRRLTPF